MATATKTKTTNGKADPDDFNRLEKTALAIYSSMSVFSPPGSSASRAFQRARAFLQTAKRIEDEGFEVCEPTLEQKILDDASAPNLPLNHPINMCSKQFGSIEKVKLLKQMSQDPPAFGLSADEGDLCRRIVEMCETRAGVSIDTID